MIEIETLWPCELRRGNSDHPRNGSCLMDAANWVAHGVIGDDPASACPVIRAYAIGLNDFLPDVVRQRLKPFILRVVGNHDRDSERARAEYLCSEVSTALPRVLSAAELEPNERAATLRQSAARDVAVRMDMAHAALAIGCFEQAACYAVQAITLAGAPTLAASVRRQVYNIAIQMLDGVLKIGKQAGPFTESVVRDAIADFERAGNNLYPRFRAAFEQVVKRDHAAA